MSLAQVYGWVEIVVKCFPEIETRGEHRHKLVLRHVRETAATGNEAVEWKCTCLGGVVGRRKAPN